MKPKLPPPHTPSETILGAEKEATEGQRRRAGERSGEGSDGARPYLQRDRERRRGPERRRRFS